MFVNATKEGIVFEEQQEGMQRRAGEWYLKDSRDGSGKTVTEVADGLVFVIDSEAPEVIFIDYPWKRTRLVRKNGD